MTTTLLNESIFTNTPVLDVSYRKLTYLPDLSSFDKVKYLYCQGNELTQLTSLPPFLIELRCHDNKLTCLPENLFTISTLKTLSCYNNVIEQSIVLPKYVKKLFVHNNKNLTFIVDAENNIEECSGLFASVFFIDECIISSISHGYKINYNKVNEKKRRRKIEEKRRLMRFGIEDSDCYGGKRLELLFPSNFYVESD